MRQHLHQLPQLERAEIEEASKVLRRGRARPGPRTTGTPITFAAVRDAAQVSKWLVGVAPAGPG